MVRSLVIAAAALLLGAAVAFAQDSAPVPLIPQTAIPQTAPRSFGPEPFPPPAPAREPELPAPPRPFGEPQAAPGPAGPPTAPPENATARIFCHQPVTVRIADRESLPERYRPFLGMWSDAAWTAQLCAALIVENVAPDGTATIVYAFGPIGSNARGPGGVLNGTGIVRDGELRFQNSDGSQFAFRPLYADLEGRLIAPQGQTYQAIFKKTP
jgi:hypothetical protein